MYFNEEDVEVAIALLAEETPDFVQLVDALSEQVTAFYENLVQDVDQLSGLQFYQSIFGSVYLRSAFDRLNAGFLHSAVVGIKAVNVVATHR